MDTSTGARCAILAVLFIGAMTIVYANCRLLALATLRRKTSRAAKIIWPLLGLALVFCAIDASYIEPQWIQITRHTIRTDKLPTGSKLRIVHLTDLHIERVTGLQIAMLTLTTAQNPDLIVLTGDYSIEKSTESVSGLRQIGQRLSKVAPTYAVDGNWDIPQDIEALRQGGVKILDDWVKINARGGGEVSLGQVPWIAGSKIRLPDDGAKNYKVMLCHMPNCIDEAASKGIDLALVGHTHGGQVRLPVFGALLPERRLVGKYQAGMYSRGDTRMYVNRGVGLEGGHAPKVRFFCRPELAVIDIIGVRK